ncbi:MAG TPA: hypothetical protein VK304_00905 [Thermoleophilaceae bacterium]|nr:hypothetical protein [Thermoleophilaceae bacterium]
MAAQDQVERGADGRQLRALERALRERRRVAGGEQELVALAKRDPEALEDLKQHLAAGLRAARLDEAQMTGRDPGVERELELGQPPPLAPPTQLLADR